MGFGKLELLPGVSSLLPFTFLFVQLLLVPRGRSRLSCQQGVLAHMGRGGQGGHSFRWKWAAVFAGNGKFWLGWACPRPDSGL